MQLLHEFGRWLHMGSGFAAVFLGLCVMLLPKFGKYSAWHRRVGRLYAVLIAGSCLLGVPLAYFRGNTYLMFLGAFTFVVVVQGWLDGVAARSALAKGNTILATSRLRWHLILMGASYIGAWSGFFATNQIFGLNSDWLLFFYVFGPSVIGAVFIARAALRLKLPELK